MRFQEQEDKGKAVKKDNQVHFPFYKFLSSAGFIPFAGLMCHAKLDLPFTSPFSWMILGDV